MSWTFVFINLDDRKSNIFLHGRKKKHEKNVDAKNNIELIKSDGSLNLLNHTIKNYSLFEWLMCT